MSLIAGIPPEAYKRVLERNGFKIIDESEYNWLLAQGDGEPVLVPKKGRILGVDVMSKAQEVARRGKFTNDLLGEVRAHTHAPENIANADELEEEEQP